MSQRGVALKMADKIVNIITKTLNYLLIRMLMNEQGALLQCKSCTLYYALSIQIDYVSDELSKVR